MSEMTWDDLLPEERKLFDECKKQLDGIWDKNIDSVIKTGQVLAKVKTRIKNTKQATWKFFCEKHFPISVGTADKLIDIGESERIESYKKHLPFSWGTLYEIEKLSGSVFRWGIKNNYIHRGTTRNEIASLERAYSSKDKTDAEIADGGLDSSIAWKIGASIDFKVNEKDVSVEELETFKKELEHFIESLGNLPITFNLDKLQNKIVEKRNKEIRDEQMNFEKKLNDKWNTILKFKPSEEKKKFKKRFNSIVDVAEIVKIEAESPNNDWRDYLPKNKSGGLDKLKIRKYFNIPEKVLDKKKTPNVPVLPKKWNQLVGEK